MQKRIALKGVLKFTLKQLLEMGDPMAMLVFWLEKLVIVLKIVLL
jgi:hypothetical protein